MPHHEALCCLDDTTDPRGTKPSVVRYWANLVTGYSATARWYEGDGLARQRCRRLGLAPMAIAHEAQALDAGTSDIGRPWEREMAVRVMTGYVAHASPTRSSGRKTSASTSKTSKPKRFAPRRSSRTCACSPSISRSRTKA